MLIGRGSRLLVPNLSQLHKKFVLFGNRHDSLTCIVVDRHSLTFIWTHHEWHLPSGHEREREREIKKKTKRAIAVFEKM